MMKQYPIPYFHDRYINKSWDENWRQIRRTLSARTMHYCAFSESLAFERKPCSICSVGRRVTIVVYSDCCFSVGLCTVRVYLSSRSSFSIPRSSTGWSFSWITPFPRFPPLSFPTTHNSTLRLNVPLPKFCNWGCKIGTKKKPTLKLMES